jgi:hypothetical protein
LSNIISAFDISRLEPIWRRIPDPHRLARYVASRSARRCRFDAGRSPWRGSRTRECRSGRCWHRIWHRRAACRAAIRSRRPARPRADREQRSGQLEVEGARHQGCRRCRAQGPQAEQLLGGAQQRVVTEQRCWGRTGRRARADYYRRHLAAVGGLRRPRSMVPYGRLVTPWGLRSLRTRIFDAS